MKAAGSWPSPVLRSSGSQGYPNQPAIMNRNETTERQDMRPILHTASSSVDKRGNNINKDKRLRTWPVFSFDKKDLFLLLKFGDSISLLQCALARVLENSWTP